MQGSRIYHQKQARRQQRIRRMKLFIMYMMFEMQMVHREVWIHPLNVERVSKGEFYRLYLDQRHFPEKFFENYCMSTLQFDDIEQNRSTGTEKRHKLQESHHSRGEVGADIEVNIQTYVKIPSNQL